MDFVDWIFICFSFKFNGIWFFNSKIFATSLCGRICAVITSVISVRLSQSLASTTQHWDRQLRDYSRCNTFLWYCDYRITTTRLFFRHFQHSQRYVACRKAWCKVIWLIFLHLIPRSDNNQKLEAASTRQNHRQHADLRQWNSRRINLKCDTKNNNNSYEAHAAGWNKRQTLEAVDPTISHRLAIDWMSIRWGKLLKHFFCCSFEFKNFHISTKWENLTLKIP